ncbi:VPRE1 protein, partial [Amia calva]|nr:VPRE1 protein [Amia calva]
MTQLPTVSTAAGQAVQISCTMSHGYFITGYWATWYQLKPGNPPRYLLHYKNSNEKGFAAPDRFSASKDTTSNAVHLSISKVQTLDFTDYYCSVFHQNSGTFTQ